MQFFPGLVFNGARVVLQTVYVAPQLFIFPLQILHIAAQSARLVALLLINNQAVRPGDDVVSHPQSKRGSRNRCHLASTVEDGIPQADE